MIEEFKKSELKELPDNLKVWLDEMLTDIVNGNEGRIGMFEKAVDVLGGAGGFDVSEYGRKYTEYKEENEKQNQRTF